MTLKELYGMVKSEKTNERIGRKQLAEMHGRVIAETVTTMGSGTIPVKLTVFDNGYVLYEEEDIYTVFHLDDVIGTELEYKTVDEAFTPMKERTVSDEVFLNADWNVRLMIEGNNRIIHNKRKTEKKHVAMSYSDYCEAISPLGYEPDYLEGFEAEIEAKKLQKMKDFLSRRIKPEHWKIYLMIEVDEMRQADIAAIMGISQQAVSDKYKRACRKIEKFRSYLEAIFDD